MLVTTDVAHDSRILREASALRDAGHEVTVVGRGVPTNWCAPDGITVTSATSVGAAGTTHAPAAVRWLFLPEHRARVWRHWGAQARRRVAGQQFDVIHAHDFNTLALAEEFARHQGAFLVYDAHEWWSGRQRHGRPTPWLRHRDRGTERRIVAEADAVLTVSPGIATRLEQWANRPVTLVRNTFPRIGTASRSPLGTRPRGLVYAGRISRGRDLEAVLAGTRGTAVQTVLMGPTDARYQDWLVRSEHGADVAMRPAVPTEQVDPVLRQYGLCAVPLPDNCDNHRLALPNKLFQAVRAGVPVVAADLPELRALVRAHRLGVLYRPGDAESLRRAVIRAVQDYPALLSSVASAAGELCWERDAERLVEVYAVLPCGAPAHCRTRAL